jgi:hypothetical protein
VCFFHPEEYGIDKPAKEIEDEYFYQKELYRMNFARDFFAYAKEHQSPLDFFSWHSYASLENNVIYAHHARERLDAYGFTNCEVFLNEWNPGCRNRGKPCDAANILSMMIALQNTPTDMCMYYDATERSQYCGIFDPLTHDVFKAYYSFFIFGQLYEMGKQCYSKVDGDGLFAMAAEGNGKKGFVVVNNSDREKTVELNVNGVQLDNGKVRAVDEEHTFDEVELLDNKMVLSPYAIRYIEI